MGAGLTSRAFGVCEEPTRLQGINLSYFKSGAYYYYDCFSATVVIRYNTIGGVHEYESCYKPIVLYDMA